LRCAVRAPLIRKIGAVQVAAIVAPVFGLILLGYILRRTGFLGDREVSALMKVAYYVALPAAIFVSLARFELGVVLDATALLGTVGATLGFAVIFFLAAGLFGASPPIRAASTVTAVRGNFVFIAFPIVFAAWGDLALAKAALITGVLAPLVTAGTVVLYRHGEAAHVGRTEESGVFRNLLLGSVVDPIIIASVAGLVTSYLALSMPGPVERFLDMLAEMAQPAALLAIGTSFGVRIFTDNMRAVSLSTLGKLLLLPACGFLILHVLLKIPMDSLDLQVPLLLMAAPSAVSTYVMGRELSSAYDMIGTTVVFTVAFSAVTMTTLLAILM